MTVEAIKRYIFVRSSELDFYDIRRIALECVNGDYEPPDYRKLCSRKILKALEKAAKNSEQLTQILYAFDHKKERLKMHEYAWDYITDIIQYQIETDNRVYLGLFGDPGTGKSMIALFMQLLISGAFAEFTDGLETILGFARSASDVNALLAEAEERELKTILSFDEIEKQIGSGSRKHHDALLQNARTSRVLRHCVVMCTITMSDFGSLIHHCDALVRTLFKDRVNKVNWCILYTTEFETNKWEPEALFAVPLIPKEGLREIYEGWKWRTQVELTKGGGILGVTGEVNKVSDALIQYAEKMGYKDYSVSRLVEIVRTEEVVGGLSLTLEQQDTAAKRSRRLMDDAPVKGRPPTTSYIGSVDDMRSAVLLRMIERGRDPIHVKALEYYIFKHCSQDDVVLELKNNEGKKTTQDTVSRWITNGEFVAEMGYAFEDVYSRYLMIKGISHVAGGGNKDSPDIVLFGEDNRPSKVLSLKCFNDKRDVTSINRNEIAKKELALSKEHDIPLEMVFFDMWTGHLHPPQPDKGQSTFTFRRPEALK